MRRSSSQVQQPVRRALGWVSVLRAVLVSGSGHSITSFAAEAAFFGSLALFPSVLVVVGVLRASRPAFGADAAAVGTADLGRLLRVVMTSHGRAAADAAQGLLETPSRRLLGVGTVAAFVVLARAMRSVNRGLHVIAGRERSPALKEWRDAALLAAFLLICGSLRLAAFTLGPFLGHAGKLDQQVSADAAGTVWSWLRWPASLLAVYGFGLLLLHQLGLPRSKHRRRQRTAGATVCVLGWVAATGLLPAYVALAGRYSPTLGSLGGGLIVLIWLYLLNLSLFLGRIQPGPGTRAGAACGAALRGQALARPTA